MAGIADISLALPQKTDSVDQIAKSLSLTSSDVRFFKRFLGLDRFCFDPDFSRQQMLGQALSQLCLRQPGLRQATNFIVLCTTLPTTGVLGETLLSELAATHFDHPPITYCLSMGHCATGLLALKIAQSCLAEGQYGVVLIGEKAFHQHVRLIKDTTIMGEAAVAVSVGFCDESLKLVSFSHLQDGLVSIAEGYPDQSVPNLSDSDSYYQMICDAMLDAVQGHLPIGDVNWIVPHNVNKISWMKIASRLGIHRERVFTRNIRRYGHCFGADPFLNTLTLLSEGLANQGDYLLLVSAGLGVSICAVLVQVTSCVPWIGNPLVPTYQES